MGEHFSNQVKEAAFAQELTKLSVDPTEIAAILAAGKIMASNVLHRHASNTPGLGRFVKWVGREAGGYGYRNAARGRGMFSRPLRELVATVVDPDLVKAYEKGYASGRNRKLVNSKGVRKALDVLHMSPSEVAASVIGMKKKANFGAKITEQLLRHKLQPRVNEAVARLENRALQEWNDFHL